MLIRLTTIALAIGLSVRARTADVIGASTPLRNDWVQSIITRAGANARVKLYNGTRPATGGTAAGTLLGTLISGAVLGTAINGVLDWDEANFTQTNTSHVNGTPTWLRVETSAGVFVADMSIPGDATFSGSVINGVNIALNPSTITAPNA